MFEKRALAFFYCVSPVHMGAGQAIGVVDNPIQRERHTNHPVFAGSGIKGALRDEFERWHSDLVERLFGPKVNAADHAGCVAFSDASVVLFPVRSLKEAFVYATCPTALARLKRMAELAGVSTNWQVPEKGPDDDSCFTTGNTKLCVNASGRGEAIILEAYQFHVYSSQKENTKTIAQWLAKQLPQGSLDYFKDKIASDLVILSDTRFSYFVENATIVEPHVRIDDDSGTADDGGLFYTENVPPEALFAGTVLFSKERRKKGDTNGSMGAAEVAKTIQEALNGKLVQLGGDATTGRGLVILSLQLS
ncbi:type III-B CRISPR module RAMP protein Cmr4 [Thermogutta sp.]|uniref:type III-B CRISPR module RAMP protein Cmr4 n=1 Tax=Thermogutta sp. TaxID=1962930 RepID=UPI00321F8FF5